MKKKGFTLVELLAVIAILAILVIVALPNVLGRFREAKKNTFMTECRTILREATNQYIQDSYTSAGAITFQSDGAENTKKLDLDGGEKKYAIEVSATGKITKAIIFDGSFCWAKVVSEEDDIKEIKGTDVEAKDIHDINNTSDVVGTFECHGEAAE